MGLDSMEERAAELLGQIHASVGEAVRAMNEAGALRRREADEAHRQHDAAQKKLDAIRKSAEELFKRNEQLVLEIQEGWQRRIAAVAVEASAEQARQHGAAAVKAIESRATNLIQKLDDQLNRVSEVNSSLRWKTLGYAALLATAIAVVAFPVLISRGSRSMATEAERLAHAQAPALARLLLLEKADIRGCEVGGVPKLCVKVESGTPSPLGKSGDIYAVIRSN
ncbi:MAG: hypothetical protein U1F39_06740 [Steroidobacteraceae bacterium]